MPKPAHQIEILYSGGASNTSPAASLGGMVSTAAGRYVLSQDVAMAPLPGVTVRHLHGAATGLGTLEYVHVGRFIRWTPNGGPAFVTVGITQSGGYAIGQDAFSMFMQIDVAEGLLPTVNTSVGVTVTNKIDSVFAPPTGTDMEAGTTDYVIMYAHNTSQYDISSSVMELVQSTPVTNVQIAGIFPQTSRFITTAAQYATMLVCAPSFGTPVLRGVATTGTPEYLNTSYVDAPAMYFCPTYRGQASDGISIDLAPTLLTSKDPTGLLAGYNWGDTVEIPLIPAGKMVSFAMRRVIAPGTNTYSAESATINITLQI